MRIVLLVLLLFGSSSFSSAEAPTPLIVEHGPRDSKKIALTFDACPTGRPDEYDDKVIGVLMREKVPATLFMSGRWVEKNPEKAQFLASYPQFEIADHSYYHPHMMEKPDDRDIRELKRTQAVIKKVTGKTPRYFRPPFGEADERIAKLAASAGLVTIQYDIASGDPDPNLSPQRIARVVLRDAKGGSIIVFHMNRNGVHTAEVLPPVIEGLRKKGFTLVTVGELLNETALNKAARGVGDRIQQREDTVVKQGRPSTRSSP
jgi:peptidoglycan/xylan/chitin deacetylase (PgdA/CDA1 family)